jgi:O-antigen ligase
MATIFRPDIGCKDRTMSIAICPARSQANSSVSFSSCLDACFEPFCLLLVIWGAFSFGAFYPWGYLPLLIGCAALGVLGLILTPIRNTLSTLDAEIVASCGAPTITRPVALGLVSVIGGVSVQLVPLPRWALDHFSPASDALLQQYNLVYATSESMHPLSIRPDATWLGLAFLSALGLLLLGTMRALSHTSWRTLIRGLILTGASLALTAIFQKATHTQAIYGFWALQSSKETFGPFGNKNHFAGWMLMVLPIGLGYFLGLVEQEFQNPKRDWRKRILWFGSLESSEILLVGFASGLMGLSLVLTLSRSGITAFLVALLIIGWGITRRRAARAHKILGVACLVCLAIVSIEWTGTDSVLARFAALGGSGLAGRLGPWRDTIRIIQDFPVAGTGLNTYGQAMMFYQTVDLPNLYVWAHNDYLQLAADGGLLLGVPIAVLVGLFVREVRRRFRERADDPIGYSIRLGAVTGLLAVALQDIVDFSLQIPGNTALFILLCAVAAARGRNRKDVSQMSLTG